MKPAPHLTTHRKQNAFSSLWIWAKTWTNASLGCIFQFVFKNFFFFLFNLDGFFHLIAIFSMWDLLLIYFLIPIIMESFRIIPALLMVTHIHTHNKMFRCIICAFNSAGTLTLELFPLTCLLHLHLFTQYERHFFFQNFLSFFHAIFVYFLFNV